MQSAYLKILQRLKENPKRWLVTGVAGFIGSNLLETLLKFDQHVVGLDNFSTGFQHNLDDVKSLVTSEQWERFEFVEGDITHLDMCLKVCQDVDYVLHQAALGSVPRSVEDPIKTNNSNVSGFLNMLVAAKETTVGRFVYAASSSTYGDCQKLPKVEEKTGRPLSPYAVTKAVNELYADVFSKTYGLEVIGLRYFNIFGKRQDPQGAYAAVIPKWFKGLIQGEPVFINGSGETSRDFCFIDNCVQANILSAVSEKEDAVNQVYNVACGQRTSLNELFEMIKTLLINKERADVRNVTPVYRDFRAGDVMHSLADISKSGRLLGYQPEYSIKEGLKAVSDWYLGMSPK